jgi:restriction system protein
VADGSHRSEARFVRYLDPVLVALRELGGSGTPQEVQRIVARNLSLSEDEQASLTKGGQPRYPNDVAWARFYLNKAGLIDASQRGVWSLTKHGQKTHLSDSDAASLFRDIWQKWKGTGSSQHAAARGRDERTPEDLVEQTPEDAQENRRGDYRQQLLETLRALSAAGFERFCQRLLRESGCQEVDVTGKSGDRGIDGTGLLQIGTLVKQRIAFQCKKYSGSVGASEIRDFGRAVQGVAEHGIILTTGTFTAEAKREASRPGAQPLELIDGERIVELCMTLGLGLVKTYEVERRFFEAFE